MGNKGSRDGSEEKLSEDDKFFIEEDGEDEGMDDFLRVNLSRCIAYAESAKPQLQREVAEKLATEAVKARRQVQIVELGGLKLLVPLSRSNDLEVRRLSAHALANLSVNATNQILMADLGAIEILIMLLETDSYPVQRQSAKALANLSVNIRNKEKVAKVSIESSPQKLSF
jgi:kinesin family protein 5